MAQTRKIRTPETGSDWREHQITGVFDPTVVEVLESAVNSGLEHIVVDNTAGTPSLNWLKFYNDASPDPTADHSYMKIPIAANFKGLLYVAGSDATPALKAFNFPTAISMIITKTQADAAAQVAPDNECLVNVMTRPG